MLASCHDKRKREHKQVGGIVTLGGTSVQALFIHFSFLPKAFNYLGGDIQVVAMQLDGLHPLNTLRIEP